MFAKAYLTFSVGLLLLWGAEARAYPHHRRMAKSVYGKNVPCALCHGRGGSTQRNPYGEAWSEAGGDLDAFERLHKQDSDADGFSNLAEIKADSGPGQARSTPKDPGRYAKLAQRVPVPIRQLELVMGRVDRIDAAEPELDAARVRELRRAFGGKLTKSERYPTLYFGVEDGQRTSVAMFSEFSSGGAAYSLLVGIGLDGKIDKVIMFEAGQDTGALYQPYLACLAGASRDDIPKRGVVSCPAASEGKLARRSQALRDISGAVRKAMTLVWTLFSK